MKLKLITAICLATLCTYSYATEATTAAVSSGQQGSTLNLADKNKQEGESFLNTNKSKPGVQTTADGLQYKVIKAGKGSKPGINDTVMVDYEGKLINGHVFDSSSSHGGPASFTLGQVIPGWTEALQMMPVGSTWEIFIPANLAYGEHGAPPAIGPNETLIFKVKLIDSKSNT